MKLLKKTPIDKLKLVWTNLRKTNRSEEDSMESIIKTLKEEETLVNEMHQNIKKELDMLNASILQHNDYFEKGVYTETTVKALLQKLQNFSQDFKELAELSGRYSPKTNSDLHKFSEYCRFISGQLQDLYKIVKENQIQWGSAPPRKIANAKDIIEKLNEVITRAWNRIDSNLRAKWAIDHKFEGELDSVKERLKATRGY